ALAAEGIPFQVVPGITAANGCASYAGIPLTHRDHAQSCIFVTGHAKDGKLSLNWDTLVQPNQTVVVYMGRDSLPLLTETLIAHGLDAATPAAIVESGTQEAQRVITGPLGDMPDRMAAAEVEGPAIIIIGGVVTLRGTLNWFASAEGEASPVEVAGRKNPSLADAGE
ncbi:MAG: uroporphyrinogen-III C-methyltransferase, partial [Rhodospirillales bacterium]